MSAKDSLTDNDPFIRTTPEESQTGNAETTIYINPFVEQDFEQSYERSVDIIWSPNSSELDTELNNAEINIPTLSSQSKISALQSLPSGGSRFLPSAAPPILPNFVPFDVLAESSPKQNEDTIDESVDKYTVGPQSIFENFKKLTDALQLGEEGDTDNGVKVHTSDSAVDSETPSTASDLNFSPITNTDSQQNDNQYIAPIDRGMKLVTIGSRPHSRGLNDRLISRDEENLVTNGTEEFEADKDASDSEIKSTNSHEENGIKETTSQNKTELLSSNTADNDQESGSEPDLLQKINSLYNLIESSRPVSRLSNAKTNQNLGNTPENFITDSDFEKATIQALTGPTDVLPEAKFSDSLDTIFNLKEDILADINMEIITSEPSSKVTLNQSKKVSSRLSTENRLRRSNSSYSFRGLIKRTKPETKEVGDLISDGSDAYFEDNEQISNKLLPSNTNTITQSKKKRNFLLLSGKYTKMFKTVESPKQEVLTSGKPQTRSLTISHKFLKNRKKATHDVEGSLNSGKSLEGLAKDYADKNDFNVPNSKDLAGRDIEDTKKIMSFGNINPTVYSNNTLISRITAESSNFSVDDSNESLGANIDPQPANKKKSLVSSLSLRGKKLSYKNSKSVIDAMEDKNFDKELKRTSTMQSKSLRFSKYFTVYSDDGSTLSQLIRSGSKKISGPMKSVLKAKESST